MKPDRGTENERYFAGRADALLRRAKRVVECNGLTECDAEVTIRADSRRWMAHDGGRNRNGPTGCILVRAKEKNEGSRL